MRNKIGQEVKQRLEELGIETPMRATYLQKEDIMEKLESVFAQALRLLSMDLSHPSIERTPFRMAKMYLNELFYGMDYENFPKITSVPADEITGQPVVVKGISVKSVCEHHLIVIDGTCDIAYLPTNKVVGLSKLNRIVDFFSRRPQIQERLTAQIGESIKFLTDSENVAVKIRAKHYCVSHRGINDPNSTTTTYFGNSSMIKNYLDTE